MIKYIEIKNFKSIPESQKIEIEPITLLMGPNSSGKSSILKPLLLMKQTVDSRDIQRSVQVDGSYVSLGSFQDFVFNHETKREVKFTIGFSPEGEIAWRTRGGKRRERRRRFLPEIIPVQPNEIIVEMSLKIGAQSQVINQETKFTINGEKFGTAIVNKIRGLKGAYSGLAQKGEEIYKFTPQKKAKFYDMSQSPKTMEYVSLLRSELGNNLNRLLSYITQQFEIVVSSIFYLGPLREEPAPLYGGTSERPQDVGTSGEDAATVLWVGKSEKKQIELKRKVEKWMEIFEIAKKIKLQKLGPFFQLFLTDWYTGISANLTDVGFGASQLLPVIVAGYYAPERSLVIAEQPEIHLHPKAQTLLADLFIDISKENKKIIVETHSEHLLMRIQRRIADGIIDRNSVALYYCEPSRKGTHIKRIYIDEFGQLEPELPEGFFEESYLETKAHLEAMVNKKKRKEFKV